LSLFFFFFAPVDENFVVGIVHAPAVAKAITETANCPFIVGGTLKADKASMLSQSSSQAQIHRSTCKHDSKSAKLLLAFLFLPVCLSMTKAFAGALQQAFRTRIKVPCAFSYVEAAPKHDIACFYFHSTLSVWSVFVSTVVLKADACTKL
jgi:hypothetical protein